MSDSQTTTWRSFSIFNHSLFGWVRRHGDKLWWFHSLYALILGIGIMWLGSRNFAFLRLAIFHLAFIWLSSLLLHRLVNQSRLSPFWAGGIRLVINYLNKNLYQQLLFFILPIYYASATISSRNIGFVALLALSATLSSLDIVYDRHVSARRGWTAIFFAFNLFAIINVMLPVLWSISNLWAMRMSAVLALIGFLTFYYPLSLWRARGIVLIVLVGSLLLSIVELGRPFIPPAPLRLARVEFGREIQRESLQVKSHIAELKPGAPLQVYGLTGIKAPLGLSEKVRHLWYQNGKLVYASSFYRMVGGREEGFRLWTRCTLETVPPRSVLRLDLETEGGQLIGRARLKTGK
ncbi:MAG: hypothetical protein HY695_15875 [Deltaproteobacteria bacterium]|nr:hypothetical protein [Deltaproteobacteria bacterium]